jgi:hypothetical protein
MLGPCLYAGCGLWRITKVEDGKPVDGLCSIRAISESLEQLTKLETMKTIGETQPSIFKG